MRMDLWVMKPHRVASGKPLRLGGFAREPEPEFGFRDHPLLAVLAEAPFLLHGWLRRGHTGAARGVVPFLQEALALLPEGMWVRTVRADSGFFEEALLAFLEARA
jgi:hypothetical protein